MAQTLRRLLLPLAAVLFVAANASLLAGCARVPVHGEIDRDYEHHGGGV